MTPAERARQLTGTPCYCHDLMYNHPPHNRCYTCRVADAIQAAVEEALRGVKDKRGGREALAEEPPRSPAVRFRSPRTTSEGGRHE